MKPRKGFFGFFWTFLVIIAAMVIPISIAEKNITNLLVFGVIFLFLLILSVVLYNAFFTKK